MRSWLEEQDPETERIWSFCGKYTILQLKVYDPWILKLYAHYMMIFRVRSFSLHSNNRIVSAFLYEISKSLRIVQYTSKYKIVCFQQMIVYFLLLIVYKLSARIIYFTKWYTVYHILYFLGSYALPPNRKIIMKPMVRKFVFKTDTKLIV